MAEDEKPSNADKNDSKGKNLPETGMPGNKKKKKPKKQKSEKGKEPAPFKLDEQPQGPVGWSALKDEIKKDYEKSEKEVEKQRKERAETQKKKEEKPAEKPEEKQPEKPEKEPEKDVKEIPEDKPRAEAKKEPKAPLETKDEKKPEDVKPTIPKGPVAEDAEERKEVIKIISRYALGGCLVIVIISAIFFFRVPQNIIGFFQNLFTGEEITEEVSDSGVQVSEGSEIDIPPIKTSIVTGANRGKSIERFDEGVQTAIISGEIIPEIKRINPSIAATFNAGMPETPQEKEDILASYMNTLMQLQNAFSTDIKQLLDNSVDRSESLSVHLSELESLQRRAKEALSLINTERDELKIQFNETTTLKEQLEEDFFVSMNQLEGAKANSLLNQFIEAQKRQTQLKSQYNALSKASTLFETAINNMDARIKDIKLNREALVKGVRVIDIEGSDLDLIIQESEA
jgi:hypothetical protein